MSVSWDQIYRGPTPGFGQSNPNVPSGRLHFLRSHEAWTTLIILVVAQAAVITSVESSNWVREMPSLAAAGFSGLALGWFSAQIRTRAAWLVLVIPVAGGLSVAGLVLHTMRLSDPSAVGGLAVRWSEFKLRIAHWIETLIDGGISNDSLPFVLLLVALVWLIAFLSAWSTVRWRNAWIALLPLGVLLLTNIAYLPEQPVFSFNVFLFAAVVLATRLHVLRSLTTWGSSDTVRPDGLSAEVLRASSWAGLVLLLAVWIVPTANNIGPLANRWMTLISPVTDRAERMGRLFVGVGSRGDSLHHHYGDVLALKGRARLAHEPLLQVTAPGTGFLRALVYDEYGGQGWQISVKNEQPLAGPVEAVAEAGTAATRLEVRTPVTVGITLLERVGDRLLFSAGDPLSADRDSNRLIGTHPADIVSLQPNKRLKSGDSYTTVGTVSAAAIDRLVAAPATYPEWVTERYLQLPDDLPPEVREYAAALSEPGTQPYVTARLVEQHLRSTFPVDLRIPAPPPLRDATAYFLFDAKRGYFDHHASAMVVLLRSLGVPARLAVGFAIDDSDFDTETKLYTLSERESWAWPEVYFSGNGWLEFNPTPSRSLILRPGDDNALLRAFGLTDTDGRLRGAMPFDEDASFEALLAELGLDLDSTNNGTGADIHSDEGENYFTTVFGWILAISMAGLVLILGGHAIWERPYRGLSAPAQRWEKLSRLAGWAGLGISPTRTPREVADEWHAALRPHPIEAAPLAAAFARERYGRPGYAEPPKQAEELDTLYMQLRNRFLRRTLTRRWPRRVRSTRT